MKKNRKKNTSKQKLWFLTIAIALTVVLITAGYVRSVYAINDYYVLENNSFNYNVKDKKALPTVTIKYGTVDWYMFPDFIGAAESSTATATIYNHSTINAGFYRKYGFKVDATRQTTDEKDGYYYYIYTVSPEDMMNALKKWWKAGWIERSNLESGITLYTSRVIRAYYPNGNKTIFTSYNYPQTEELSNKNKIDWSEGTWEVLKEECYDKPINVSFSKTGFSIESVDETGTSVGDTSNCGYEYADIYYGETTDTIQYPGKVSGYEYTGYEITAGGKMIAKGTGTTLTFTAKYETIEKNDVVLTFYYKTVQENSGFVPTATPTPTFTPTPVPTLAPNVTATPTPVPTEAPKPTNTPRPTATPKPDAISEAEYEYHFTTDMGYTMSAIAGNSKYQVASTMASTVKGTLSDADSTKRSNRYRTGTDAVGNTWYFIADGTAATYVHPAIYNGYHADSAEVKYITELVFPESITSGNTTYTVTSIGGGTSNYHRITDKSTETIAYDYNAHYGYYYYYRETGNPEGNTGYYNEVCDDHEYFYGVLGNGYIETEASYEKTHLTNGERTGTKIKRNYYVYNTTLKSITIPDTVTWIADYAFQYCQNLSEIHGGASVRTIGVCAFAAKDAFYLNSSSTIISYDYDFDAAGNSKISAVYTWDDYYLYNEEGKWDYYVSDDGNGEKHLECDGEGEHISCKWFTEEDTELMLHTQKMVNLTEVPMKFPEFPVLNTIREAAFDCRKNLWEVSLSDTVQTIWYGAFNKCSLDSIRIPGSRTTIREINNATIQESYPTYETLGTNQAGEKRTIIYTTPSASNAITYGRTWSEYYRLKAGYLVTYHSNNGSGQVVEQMTDIEFYPADWVWCAGKFAINSDGSIYLLNMTNQMINGYSLLGKLSGGFDGVEYSGQYKYTDTSDNILTMQVYYIRDGAGNLWCFHNGTVYDSTPSVVKIKISAGTEVLYASGIFYYLNESGLVCWYRPINGTIGSVSSSLIMEQIIPFGDGTVFAYNLSNHTGIKVTLSSDSPAFFSIELPSGVTPLVCDTDCMVDTDGNFWMLYNKKFTKLTYDGSVTLAALQGINGRIYDETFHPVALYGKKNGATYTPIVTVNTNITGVIKDIVSTEDVTYYWMEDGSVMYYAYAYREGMVYRQLFSGTIVKKLSVGTENVFALTEEGVIYDISTPSKTQCITFGKKYMDIAYYDNGDGSHLLAVAEDGTLWGMGNNIYKINGNWKSSTSLIQVPGVRGAKLVYTGLPGYSQVQLVYSREGVYSSDSYGTFSLKVIDFGTYFDAELWGYMFENPGFTCTEWNTKADGTGTAYYPEDKVSLTENLELYAQWGTAKSKTVIQYDRNGGAGTMSVTTLEEKETTAVVSVNRFVREGYQFTVWNTKADGSGTTYNERERITVKEGTVTTLYAQWKEEDYLSPNPEVFSYTLVYMRYPYGTSGNIVWKTKTMSYLTVETVEGQPYTPAAGYTVNFVLNPLNSMSTRPKTYNETLELVDATGFDSVTVGAPTFHKWLLYLVDSKAEQYYAGIRYAQNDTLSGLTKENGATVYLYPTWVSGSGTVELPYVQATGYHFSWNTEKDGSGISYTPAAPDGDEIGSMIPFENMTLYGKWEPMNYTVMLDGRGATSTDYTKSVVMTFDEESPSIIVPTKTGYTFQGYYTESRGNGTKYYDEAGKSIKPWTIAKNTTLYAYWIQNPVLLPEKNPTVLPLPEEEKVVQGEIGGTGGEARLYAEEYISVTGNSSDLQSYLTCDMTERNGWIPSTEQLSFCAKFDAWLLNYTLQRCSGTEWIRIYVTVPYRTQYEQEDETLVISERKTATYCVEVPKTWSYWTIVDSNLYYPDCVIVKNEALKNGEFTLAVDGKTSETYPLPTCTEIRYGEKENHIFWEKYDKDGTPVLELSVQTEQYLISETVNSLPDVEQHLSIICENAAWADNRNAKVKNDLLRVNDRTVVSDALSETGKGEASEELLDKDNVENVVYSQLYETGIELDEYTPNGSYPTSVTVRYQNASEAFGKSEKITKTLRNVNSLMIHTPVACQGVIVAGMEKTDSNVRLDLKESMNFFTLRIENMGTHMDCPGYGTKDFTWAFSGKSNIATEKGLYLNQIRFSFDVYVSAEQKFQKENNSYDASGDYLLKAGTWMTIGKQDVTVYVPSSMTSGRYPVHFRTIAVNCPKTEESGYIVSGMEQKSVNINPEKYVATDGIVVTINNSLQDFKITDTDDPLAKKVLLSGCQALTLKKGYPFFFDFLAQAEQENDAAQISIVPEFYWISSDGNRREKAVLYQKGVSLNEEVCYSLKSLRPELVEENGKMRWRWSGRGYIPADVQCKTIVDGETKKDGYLVIAFGVFWKSENGEWYTFMNWKNTELAADAEKAGWNYYQFGDVIRYDLSKSISSDYEVGGLE